MITNTCISEGTIDPSNDCSECNTNLSTTDWVSRSAGSLCDDGIFCTINDACDGAGLCISDFSPDGTFCASDGNECTQNICLAGGCAHPFEDAGISCGSQTETECNHANTCNGAGVCLDNFEDSGIPCGDPTVTQCDLADICNGVGGCVDNAVAEGTTCDDENPLTAEDACDGAGICEGVLIPEASIVEGIGPRALLVTPLPVNSPVPVALNITSPDWPCLDKFVNLDGTLTTTPVSQTPAQWGTINVHDPDIVPDTTYSISAVIGEIVAPPGFGKTAIWGDVDLNEMANIGDVLLTVDGWLGSIRVPQEAMDLLPCIQDERINLRDILAAVGAWLGSSYESRCSLPCP